MSYAVDEMFVCRELRAPPGDPHVARNARAACSITGVRRRIIQFHQDESGDWVAALDCGHVQHMRHRPPFFVRPWVEDAAGRQARIGTQLDCVRCDRMEWPDGVVPYRRTPEFGQDTVPRGLTSCHATKTGVWARIHVLEGTLQYHVEAPVGRCLTVAAPSTAIVVPELRHRVEMQGPVRFYVEFHRPRVKPAA